MKNISQKNNLTLADFAVLFTATGLRTLKEGECALLDNEANFPNKDAVTGIFSLLTEWTHIVRLRARSFFRVLNHSVIFILKGLRTQKEGYHHVHTTTVDNFYNTLSGYLVSIFTSKNLTIAHKNYIGK